VTFISPDPPSLCAGHARFDVSSLTSGSKSP
jgi:hypothetical protein